MRRSLDICLLPPSRATENAIQLQFAYNLWALENSQSSFILFGKSTVKTNYKLCMKQFHSSCVYTFMGQKLLFDGCGGPTFKKTFKITLIVIKKIFSMTSSINFLFVFQFSHQRNYKKPKIIGHWPRCHLFVQLSNWSMCSNSFSVMWKQKKNRTDQDRNTEIQIYVSAHDPSTPGLRIEEKPSFQCWNAWGIKLDFTLTHTYELIQSHTQLVVT